MRTVLNVLLPSFVFILTIATTVGQAATITRNDFKPTAIDFDFSSFTELDNKPAAAPLSSITTVTTDDFQITGGKLAVKNGALLADYTYTSWSPVTISFFNPVSAVGFDMIGKSAGTLRLLDASPVPAELISIPLPSGSEIFLGYDAGINTIASVVFDINDDTWLDNLIYQTATPAPLPGTVWLLGSCLAGLAGLKRKKMRQAG